MERGTALSIAAIDFCLPRPIVLLAQRTTGRAHAVFMLDRLHAGARRLFGDQTASFDFRLLVGANAGARTPRSTLEPGERLGGLFARLLPLTSCVEGC